MACSHVGQQRTAIRQQSLQRTSVSGTAASAPDTPINTPPHHRPWDVVPWWQSRTSNSAPMKVPMLVCRCLLRAVRNARLVTPRWQPSSDPRFAASTALRYKDSTPRSTPPKSQALLQLPRAKRLQAERCDDTMSSPGWRRLPGPRVLRAPGPATHAEMRGSLLDVGHQILTIGTRGSFEGCFGREAQDRDPLPGSVRLPCAARSRHAVSQALPVVVSGSRCPRNRWNRWTLVQRLDAALACGPSRREILGGSGGHCHTLGDAAWPVGCNFETVSLVVAHGGSACVGSVG
mmetsp:Transcript_6400/g.17831  ORF Transcript_6400/g.17831 Transcript_6400/m.17831 type:complete len:290 (-) Transcript_6400:975-1844(-)